MSGAEPNFWLLDMEFSLVKERERYSEKERDIYREIE